MSAPARVGVIGGGRMGAGIAHAFLLAGSRVTVLEADTATAAAASARIDGILHASLARGARAPVTVLKTTSDPGALTGCDLVVEAVPEDAALKREVLARAETLVGPGAAIATNTSSIPLADLTPALTRPERLVGLHFFTPVPSSLLVEIIVGDATASTLVADARAWVAALEKTGIVVRDSPGFASSRLGVALALEAIRMLEDGVASADDIDAAMCLGYRHAMGPLRTTDVVGLDVRLAIAEQLEARLGERFTPPALLRRLVADGRLGRKSGGGFYEWSQS